MEKNRIKQIIRESLDIVKETEKNEKSKGDDKKSETDYSEIQRKLDGTMLKQSQVMAAAGLGNPDDATARSLFSKKVRKDTNDEGGIYQFNAEELASIIKVINNPSAYLNSKK